MSFENIIGQDVAVRVIRNMIAQGQVMGAYLFSGHDGVGKRTAGLEFAKAINCERHGDDACDNCVSCNKIDSGNHPDVFTLYPEGPSNSIKIDRIREIRYEVSLKPYEGAKRIFIINDAEEMREDAQNAFLKVLEEPPQNHILILTVSNIAGLLPTVISRCKILKFNILNQDQVRQFLQRHDVNEKEAVLFSHMAMGSIGRALSFKERDIISLRDHVVNDFFFQKSAILKEAVLLEHMNEDVEESIYMLLCWYRDLLVSRFVQHSDELLNIDRVEQISSYAVRFSEEKLQRDILTIMKTMEYVRKNVNPKVALFNMAVELKRS